MEDMSRHCPFTQFTYDLFVKAELNQAITHLQHDSGFNINIVFYLLWLAKARYGRLTKRNLKMLQAQIMLWHQRVISELKYTCALLANQTDPIALQIKQALQEEIIKAHIIEQHMLFESRLKSRPMRRSSQQQLSDACVSMIHYCELKNDLLIEDDQAAFIQLFSAVFNDIVQSDIQKQIRLAFDGLKKDQPTQLMWQEF